MAAGSPLKESVARPSGGPRPAKVFHFTDMPGFGGMEKMILAIMTGLDRARWEPVLLHRRGRGFDQLDEAARDLSIRVWPVEQMQGRRDAGWVLPVAQAFRREGPAVFHAHQSTGVEGLYGLLAAVTARVPAIVVSQHLLDHTDPLASRLKAKLLSAGVDRYVAVSREVAARLRPTCLFPSRKIRVIYNGISLGQFDQNPNPALRATLQRGTRRPVVLCLARLDKRQKGLRFLVSAAAHVPEAQFVFAGEGPERPELEAQAKSLGIEGRVTLLGLRDDVPDLLACCDLLVLPSLSEGFGVAVLEAMAAGKPVVASAIGGVDEVVLDGETGILVPPGDPGALAGAIHRVLADPALARRFGQAGRARAQEFSLEKMVERTASLYEEVLSSHKRFRSEG